MEDKDAIIHQLRQENAELRKIIEELNRKIADLEEKLRLNSQNSSKSPSSDRYPKKQPPPEDKKERKTRQGFFRKWFPKEEVSEFIQYYPQNCDGCGGNHFLPKVKVAEARQVVEIPPIKPIVTEHQAMKCRCVNCGKQVRAHLPQEVTSSVFGPKIKAWCTVLSGKFHLSKNQIKELFGTLLGISIAKGSVINTHYQAALMLQHPYEEALQTLRKNKTAYADETGWRTKGQTKWLWQATDKEIVIFKIFASRGKKAFHSLLGKDVVQNLVTDRFQSYSTDGLHQYCWAHLKRDFKRIEQRSGHVSTIGKLMGSLCSFLFKCVHERERGEISKEEFIEKAKEIKDEFHYLFKLGLRADTHDFKLGKTGRFCERILRDEDKLWAFIKDQDLDLTNNLSERNLRPAVIWRKISFGNKSARGEQFVERILSVVETIKIQGRNILDYLVACFSARSKCLAIPSFVCIN